MEEYEPWMSKPEDENVVVEIKSATFGWNEVIYIYVYISGGSSVGQNKLLQLIIGYIYILKHLQSNFIGKILFFGNS